jgi:hypothetical protein
MTKHKNTYANPVLGVVGIIVAVATALVLTFMLVSYVHVLVTGHVAGFQTTAWMSWLRPISLIVIGLPMLLGDSGIINAKEQTDNGCIEVPSYSRSNQIIAKASVGVIAVLGVLAIFSGIFGWFENTYWEDCYFITVLGSIHMLWICSVIAMLLEKELARWHRTLNILAPSVINGVVVCIILLSAYIPRPIMQCLDDTITDTITMIAIGLSAAFIIVVWTINTIRVLRANSNSLIAHSPKNNL